ncbi:MAG TPA: folate-binding protein [Allosphingosinicella sp.]|nr:folate-binding protein [Allosphingosinicella sp.]
MAATTLVDRAILRLSGEEVRAFLQGLVTNDLALLAPDRPLWAGLLTPQGKALFDFILWDGGETVLIDCEREAAGELASRLSLYRLRRRLDIEPVAGLCVHWSRDGDEGLADPRLPELGRRWLAAPSEQGADWRGHRLRLGVTEGRAELGSGETLWLECNAAELNGVSFTKGCYVGQENTARMNYRSKVNRRLVVVPIDEAGAKARAVYPDLGVAVEHRRIDALGGALRPAWLEAALA